MKNITLDIPRNGTLIQFSLRTGASSGQVAIVTSDEVEIRIGEPAQVEDAQTKSPRKPKDNQPSTYEPELVLKRLRKLKPTNRLAATNSIKAMFQFSDPISDEEAKRILDDLRKNGYLTIDSKDKLQFSK